MPTAWQIRRQPCSCTSSTSSRGRTSARTRGAERFRVPRALKPGRLVPQHRFPAFHKIRPSYGSSCTFCERAERSRRPRRKRRDAAPATRPDAEAGGRGGTHTSLWCVYTLSKRASGAIHLTGSRPCRCGRNETNQRYDEISLPGWLRWPAPRFKS